MHAVLYYTASIISVFLDPPNFVSLSLPAIPRPFGLQGVNWRLFFLYVLSVVRASDMALWEYGAAVSPKVGRGS